MKSRMAKAEIASNQNVSTLATDLARFIEQHCPAVAARAGNNPQRMPPLRSFID